MTTTTPEGIAEAKTKARQHSQIDALTSALAEMIRAALPLDLNFVLVVAKQYDHHVHTSTGTDMEPHAASWVLDKASGDLKAKMT